MQQSKYSSSFKQEAIHYALSHPDKTRKQVAEELGIAYGTLKQWFRGLDLTSISPQNSEPKTNKQLEQEIRRLKRELEMSYKENEILKKFSVYHLGIMARQFKRRRCTTNSRHSLGCATSLLQRDFKVDEPNQIWVGDITYIRVNNGWMYFWQR